MRKEHSTKWKSSVQPRKQRKYVFQAPLHIKGDQLHVHLAKDLRVKHGMRAVRVRKGDTVKVLRGTYKGKEGVVESVDLGRARITVAKVEITKKQGGVAKYPLRPSNCMITALASDKRRFKRTEGAKVSKAPKAQAKAEPRVQTTE